MDALRRVHEALVRGGLLLDLMPFTAWVPVEAAAGELGRIDARRFAGEVRRIEAARSRIVREGLFMPEREIRFDVLEHFDSSARLLEEAAGWRGATVPKGLRARLERAQPPFRVRETVVLRRLRAR